MTAVARNLSHVFPRDSGVNGAGHLEIGGCDAIELAERFGTPAYILAEDDLRFRARAFCAAMAGAGGEVLFASKALPCTAVYRLLAAEGLGCDVASGGELYLALRGGFDPQKIYFHGNAKSVPELGFAIESGVGHIVLDSFDDIDRLERVAYEAGREVQVLIRVTPGVAGETHAKVSTGQADSKFGFGLDDSAQAIARLESAAALRLVGLHMHIGSQLFSLEPFRAAVAAIAELGDFPVYNLGGGLGAAYRSDQQPPSIEDYVAANLAAARDLLGPGKRILLEPGRSLVANAGVTLYAVETVKRNVSTWVAVDGGMSDNLRPMLYGSPYEACLADRPLADGGEPCRVAGKHCESGDVIIPDAMLDNPRPGDILVTPATGAYGHAMANNYNGIPRPPVIFVSGGEAREVVRRETYDDLAARDV